MLIKGLAAAGVLAVSVATMSTAGADSGDGSLACNAYEICFSRDGGNTTYQKHFWYGANHDGYRFTNVSTGSLTGSYLEDNAAQIRNRDGSCDVKVIDWNGALPSVTQTVSNNGVWTMLKDGVRDQNNEHQRVNC